MQNQQISSEAQRAEFQGDTAWKCPVPACGEVMEFFNEEAAVINFLIVHHLVNQHAHARQQVLNHDARLEDATKEYIGFPRDRHGKLM